MSSKNTIMISDTAHGISHTNTSISSVEIALSRVHFPVHTLGPGQRLGIWLQGCSIRCAGCVSADTWAQGKTLLPVSHLLNQLLPWVAKADGITISGGEPFEQPEALLALLQGLKARSSLDILVYSGMDFMALQALLPAFTGLIDALISGPYDSEQAQTKVLMGSDNQAWHLLTPLGQQRFTGLSTLKLDNSQKTLDVMFDASGEVWFAGIPRHGDLLQLQALMAKEGNTIQLTVDKGRQTQEKER